MASSYRNIHPVDEILSNLVAEAVPSDAQLIADKVCENVRVPQRSGTLLIETSRNFMGAGAGLDLERAARAVRVSAALIVLIQPTSVKITVLKMRSRWKTLQTRSTLALKRLALLERSVEQ